MPKQFSEECCEMTYCAISHWYKHIFDKLGWMVLAKAHKNIILLQLNIYIVLLHLFSFKTPILVGKK